MVVLKNWEFFANSGIAVVGATVTPYVASDVHPNPGAPVSVSAITDANGMWVFGSLADGQLYDVKVEYASSIKWYKGNARVALGHLYDDTSPDPNRNLIPNGGLDSWEVTGASSVALPTADPGDVTNCADGWQAWAGSGDSGTVQRNAGTRMTDSKYSCGVAYTRSGGQALVTRYLPTRVWEGLRGKTFAISAQVFQQTTTSKLRVFVDDGTGPTSGTSTDVVNVWTTISHTVTISAVATQLRIGVQTNRTTTGALTFLVDNMMADIGSVVPVFAPELVNASPDITYTTIDDTMAPAANPNSVGRLLSNLANRVKSITGEATWRTAPASTIAAIKTAADALAVTVGTKVNRSGDTMTGLLTIQGALNTFINISRPAAIANSPIGMMFSGNSWATGWGNVQGAWYHAGFGSDGVTVLWGFDGTDLRIGGFRVWHANNDGAGSSLDADLLDGVQGFSYLARANHTGTQVASTISDLATAILARSQHTGTQVAATISDFSAAALAATAAAYAAIGHTHAVPTSMAKVVMGTYAGDGAVSRVINVGITPLFVAVQRIAGAGGGGMAIALNHDALLLETGVPAANGTGWGFGPTSITVTSGSGFNSSGSTYRYVVVGT